MDCSKNIKYAQIDSYDSGSSRFYVVPETPLNLGQSSNSPVPPPRHRHNPFNRPENSPHQRSHSLRNSSSGGRIDENRMSDNASLKYTITFRELHNSYGRPILTDYNVWRHEQKTLKEKDTAVDNLISL